MEAPGAELRAVYLGGTWEHPGWSMLIRVTEARFLQGRNLRSSPCSGWLKGRYPNQPEVKSEFSR